MCGAHCWLEIVLKYFLPAYFVGAIPYGYLLGRLKGMDIRQHGSGNIGATNVWRCMGKGWGITIFILDFLKMPMASILINYFLERFDSKQTLTPLISIQLVIFLGSVLGHNYPIWLGFRGGKGVATSAGGLLWLTPRPFFIAFIVWIVVFAFFRYISLASIMGAIVLPFGVWFFYPKELLLLFFMGLLSVLVIGRHRMNIQRLMNGTEHRWVKKNESRRDNPRGDS